MRKSLIPIAATASLLSGCGANLYTLGNIVKGPQEVIYVLVKTEPDGANLTFVDGTRCQSPCRVGVGSEALVMRISQMGYHAKEVTVTRRTPSPMIVPLEQTVVTEDIDTFELPDL